MGGTQAGPRRVHGECRNPSCDCEVPKEMGAQIWPHNLASAPVGAPCESPLSLHWLDKKSLQASGLFALGFLLTPKQFCSEGSYLQCR